MALWTLVLDIRDLTTEIAMPGTDVGGNGVTNGVGRRVCALCGQRVDSGTGLTLLVPDSSALAAGLDGLDGERLVTVCGNDHAAELVAQARVAWVKEQRWFGRLCRASVEPGMRDSSLPGLRDRARLSAQQLQAALRWNAGRTDPRTVLPGGQPLLSGDFRPDGNGTRPR